MRLPKRGEKGFTLIELLIVVAILGVLAAVVIPNVGRFIGRGEQEAADTELSNVQTAVIAMMTDNNLQQLATAVGTSTNDMQAFPDTTAAASKGTDPDGNAYDANDKAGFILYQHDIIGGDSSATTDLVNYVATNSTSLFYTVDAMGTVTQHTTSGVTP
jgi:type IV pilus assembly protein PilA